MRPSPLQPAIRFPQFVHDGDWEVRKLGEVCETFSGGTPSTHRKEYYGHDYPFIRSAEIDSNTTELFISELGLINSSSKLVKTGDILIALYGANSGEIAISKLNGAINQAILCVRCIEGNLFLYHILSHTLPNIVKTKLQGGQGNLSGEIIKNIFYIRPSLAEQEAIAGCLSSLDERIAGEEGKALALRQHKKGLMQQLFPAEGETRPALRFPDFQQADDWEVRKLGEVYSFGRTNTLSRDKLNYEAGEVKNIHYGDIHTKYKSHFDVNLEDVPYISDISSIKIHKADFCNKGDVIFADASEDLNDIGKCIEVVNVDNIKVVCGLHTLFCKKNSNDIIVGFAGHVLKSNYFTTQIKFIAQGVKVLSISSTRLKSLTIPLPSLAEQEAIAGCLSSLDERIAAQEGLVASLRQYKKGLMQGLFPVGILQ